MGHEIVAVEKTRSSVGEAFPSLRHLTLEKAANARTNEESATA